LLLWNIGFFGSAFLSPCAGWFAHQTYRQYIIAVVINADITTQQLSHPDCDVRDVKDTNVNRDQDNI
jgi:hypothetical protein